MDERDLLQALTKFHREVFVPDVERIVRAAERRLADQMRARAAAISQPLRELRTVEARIDD